MAQSVETLIKDLGGNAKVAGATGFSAGAVALWVHRKKIPRTAWPELLEAYPARVTLPLLRTLEQQDAA